MTLSNSQSLTNLWPCLDGKMLQTLSPSYYRASNSGMVQMISKRPIQSTFIGGIQVLGHGVDDHTDSMWNWTQKETGHFLHSAVKPRRGNLHSQLKPSEPTQGSVIHVQLSSIKSASDKGDHGSISVRNRPQRRGCLREQQNCIWSDHLPCWQKQSKSSLLRFIVYGPWCMVSNRYPLLLHWGRHHIEAWHNKKPDVSHLRVWGCLAYVLTQKGQEESFGHPTWRNDLHWLPCWLQGWQFYTGHKKFISERAAFDERYFPGIKPTSWRANHFPPSWHQQMAQQYADLGGAWIPRNATNSW